MMEVQRDFKELLVLLNEHKVEYVIVGGYALAFHGVPRYTGDMDILVKADKANAERILAALDGFGFGGLILLSIENYGIFQSRAVYIAEVTEWFWIRLKKKTLNAES